MRVPLHLRSRDEFTYDMFAATSDFRAAPTFRSTDQCGNGPKIATMHESRASDPSCNLLVNDCRRYGVLQYYASLRTHEPFGLIPSVKSAQSAATAAWDGTRGL